MALRKTSFPWLLVFIAAIAITSCSSQREIQSAQKKLLAEPVIQTAHIGISVYDATEDKYVFNYQGDKYFVPASNIKIPTCYAAMKYLGDSLTALRYVVRNADTILIAGTGSPDLLHPDYKDQAVFNFLKRYKQVTLSVKPYTDFLGSGWSWSDYRAYYMAQRSDLPLYGNVARFNWKNEGNIEVMPSYFKTVTTIANRLPNGFDIGKPWEENKFTVSEGSGKTDEVPFRPDAATIKALLEDTLKSSVTIDLHPLSAGSQRLYSRPVDSVLRPMMHRSDNFFAEQMLLMVSQEKLGVMDDRMIIDTLLKTDLADLPQKPRWVDGSGLSRYNLFTPQDFVAILHKMEKEFGMQRIKTILPTGGKGTISSYYKEDSGYIYAKTGSLSGVVSLSGYLYTSKGRLLIFSVLVNNHNGSAADVRRAVERFVRKFRK
ncbi:MAG: D-alanyl-D-alanine carboxypeptidase/D-alanyl-D-alanine-endopeptidase [Chitinophagaceae bacterium]